MTNQMASHITTNTLRTLPCSHCFLTAILCILILWFHLIQINAPLQLWRVNRVTPQKWRCACKNTYVVLGLTSSVSTEFDCLYCQVQWLSGYLPWLKSKRRLLYTVSLYSHSQITSCTCGVNTNFGYWKKHIDLCEKFALNSIYASEKQSLAM